jgi:hypothetical protein
MNPLLCPLQDIYHIWKEMVSLCSFWPGLCPSNNIVQNWKTSIKAKHLVMALHDHFSERGHHAPSPVSESPQDSTPVSETGPITPRPEISSTSADNETWALQYITVRRVQPLIEAIDDDVSSFVTVSEVNVFTSAAPEGWRCVNTLILPDHYLKPKTVCLDGLRTGRMVRATISCYCLALN